MTDELKDKLKRILANHEGRYRAITSRGLSSLTGSDDRQIRLAIRELRADGFPVLSSSAAPAGFYLPLNRSELEEFLASMRARLIEDARTRRDVKKYGDYWLTPAEQGRLI